MFIRKLKDEEYQNLKQYIINKGQNFNGDDCIFYDFIDGNTWRSYVMCFRENFRVCICEAYYVNEDGSKGRDLDEIELTDWIFTPKKIIKKNFKYNLYLKYIEPEQQCDCDYCNIKMLHSMTI